MKLLFSLSLLYVFHTVAFGQSAIRTEANELLYKEYLAQYHYFISAEIERRQLNRKKAPYSLGDSFDTQFDIVIMNHFNDSTILFESDKESLIPKGFTVKVDKMEANYYFLTASNKSRSKLRRGYISIKDFDDYFHPSNKDTELGLLSELRRIDKRIKVDLAFKNGLSELEFQTIIENIGFHYFNDR